MDEQFDIQVSDVTKKEFTQAGSEMIRGLVGPAFLAVAVVTIVIMMFLGDYSLKAFLPPFVIVGALLLIAWLMVSRGYKDFPKDITFSYLIDVEGWQLTVGEESANIDWRDTAKLVVRSQVVLLYNEDNRSNILPRRCLTDHQLEQMPGLVPDQPAGVPPPAAGAGTGVAERAPSEAGTEPQRPPGRLAAVKRKMNGGSVTALPPFVLRKNESSGVAAKQGIFCFSVM